MFFPGANNGGLFSWLLLIAIGVIIYVTSKNKDMKNNNSDSANMAESNQPAPGKGRSNNAFVSPQGAVTQRGISKYSFLSIFMAATLFIVLVMFGERLIFDLNRYINPVIDKEYTQWKNQINLSTRGRIDYDISTPVRRPFDMKQDSGSAVNQAHVYYPEQEKGRYLMYKLIIHAAVIIPVFVLAFALFYFKRRKIQLKPLLISFLLFGFWMMFHFLGETFAFVMDEYRNIAIYVILILLGIIFAGVSYFSQAKLHREKDSKRK